MTLLAILLTLLSASALYLSAPHQRWLAQRWQGGRRIGLVLLGLALASWWTAQGDSAGGFGLLIVLMLGCVLVPAASLLRGAR